uniref:SprB repeat-containing protein n=1 Tax=Salinimicrobium xinjiangense TaxID=438596 RepID=UPI00146DB6FF
MKSFTTFEEPNRLWLHPKKLLYLSFLLLFFMNVPAAISQDDPDGYPGDVLRSSHCPANDLTVLDAYLEGLEGCVSCDENKEQKYPLWLGIYNNSNSTRPVFAYWAVLEITDTDGTRREAISGCSDEDILGKNKTKDGITWVKFDDITYTCGSSLRLTEIYMAYTSAADTSCPIDVTSISPKCGTSEDVVIRTPLSASADVTAVSCFGGSDGKIDLSPTGGSGEYSFEWSKTGDPTFSSTVEDPENLSQGTYSVLVTDTTEPVACTFTLSGIIVGEAAILSATVDSQSLDCYAENGTGSI